jgi:endopolyphosphatase
MYVSSIKYPHFHIKDADFVVWTGDSPRHNSDPIFHPTTQEIIEQLDWQISEKIFSATYRSDRVVMVYPTIGNNDVYPHDTCYPGPNQVLTNITGNWNYWLASDPQAQESMYHGGYYSMLHDNQLRIIGLNTLYFVQKNDKLSINF